MKKLEYAKILYPKSEITITVPNRIHMFTYRASFNVEGKTGGAGISIKGNQIMNVRTMDIQYYNDNPLLDYFISVFKRILKYDGFFKVDYKNALEEHIGLGTSISQTVALCFAINHLFYNPLSDVEIRKLIMKEYREIDQGKLIRGLGTGVGAACSLYGGINFVTNSQGYVHLTPSRKYAVAVFFPMDIHFRKRIKLEEENTQKEISFRADEESFQQRKELIYESFIPALLSEDWNLLGRTTAEIHTMGVKKIECERFDYEYEIELINMLLEQGVLLAGLSSLGPVNYALVPWEKAEWLKDYLVNKKLATDILFFDLCRHGIEILYER